MRRDEYIDAPSSRLALRLAGLQCGGPDRALTPRPGAISLS
ncbi:hypothetical protein HMPREF1144_3430 [Klebsiella sp. OBRC7]|nr:hypothetical protein HMPREF1144_3430 [Klebsiella sp. OBRC7]